MSSGVTVQLTVTTDDGSGRAEFTRTLESTRWSGQPQFVRQMVEGVLALVTDDVMAALLATYGPRQITDPVTEHAFAEQIATRRRLTGRAEGMAPRA